MKPKREQVFLLLLSEWSWKIKATDWRALVVQFAFKLASKMATIELSLQFTAV